jgi:sulfhydrogenase subunit alpha
MSERCRRWPLTRVEGHGTIEVILERDTVKGVRLSLKESPRLFEALLVGKQFQEIPEIICRICSICSSVHRVTALQAIETAFGIEVPPGIRLYQELLVHGGHIESHALHLACLVLPDYFGVASFAELARQAPKELECGLKLKALGNRIQETIGGRTIHPVNLQVGAIGRMVSRTCLEVLLHELPAVRSLALQLLDIVALHTPQLPAKAGLTFLALEPAATDPLFGKTVALSSGQSFSVRDYRSSWQEHLITGSHDKRSRICGNRTTSGALSRLTLRPPSTPLAHTAFMKNREALASGSMWANPLAQAVEIIQSIESVETLLARLIDLDENAFAAVPFTCRAGTGSSACEAPRGLLLHSYTFDRAGFCTSADVITPTAINHESLEHALLELARELWGHGEARLTAGLEQLVRAYDPCISCAVHLVRV